MDDATPVDLNAPFLKACRGEATSVTPVWLMRQAGRYQPSYRRLREQHTFLELVQRPEVAAEITVNAVREIGVDAAILFADLLPLLQSLGLELEYRPGEGPVILNPVTSAADIDRLEQDDVRQTQHYVYDAIRLARGALSSNVPLIGFAGAPFTLAAYAVEGGKSRHFSRIKTLMWSDPGAFDALLTRLTDAVIPYLQAQIEAGAQAVQLFDSWVGCLTPADYRKHVLKHVRRIFASVGEGVPRIYFGVNTAMLLPLMIQAGGDVLGLDWHMPLGETWMRLGVPAVQGNLDPVALLAPRETLLEKAAGVLAEADGRPGHIFNLGHGVLPDTPYDNVKALVDYVHEASVR